MEGEAPAEPQLWCRLSSLHTLRVPDWFRYNLITMAETLTIPTDALAEFCRRWRVRELSLFGSAARTDFRAGSDVDLLVRFDPEAPWSLWDFVTMRDELAQVFGRDVDLVEEDAIRNPFPRTSILRDKRVLYAALRNDSTTLLGRDYGMATCFET